MHISDKNLLLVNPWIFDFTAFDLWSKPLGLLYLASFLREAGFKISFIDCLEAKTKTKKYGVGHFQRQPVKKPSVLDHIPRHYARYGISEDEFLHKLESKPDPDAILVTSIMTYWYPGVQRCVEILRKVYPDTPLIMGGIYATLIPEHAKNVIKPDYLISGPGEEKVLHLLSDIFNLNLENYQFPKDLDAYPYPAFDLYEQLEYLIIMTARGCPFDCSFCAQRKIAMTFTQRSPVNVVEEIVQQYSKYKLYDFAFYDDALFINRDKHIKPILEALIRKKIPVRLHSPNGLFVRYIDKDLAELMYKSNFKTIRISFETSNENRRRDMNNKISNDGMITAVENLISAGYKPHDIDAYVIMGLPGQDVDEVLASIIFVNNLGVKVSLASYSPIPGTRDFDRAVDLELITADIDPLLTNKSIFPLNNSPEEYETYRKVRIFSQILNEASEKSLCLFADSNIGPGIKKALGDL